MQLQYLKYLLDIGQTHSLTQTADDNFISRQALTKNLKSLEKEVGEKLYYVDGKKCFLTPAGEVLIDFAKAVMKEEKKMQERLVALHTQSIDVIPLNILSFSNITNQFTHSLFSFGKIISQPIDVSFTSISSYTLESSIDLIKKCSENIIVLTISSKILNYMLSELSGTIVDYAVILKDTTAICYSADIPISERNDETTRISSVNKAIFSLIPSNHLVYSYSYRNISSDSNLVEGLIMNENTIVFLPYTLALRTFNFDFEQYRVLDGFEILHLILFKEKLPFQDQLVKHIQNVFDETES